MALLDTIPAIGRRIADIVVSEVGVELQRFPTAAHLAACRPQEMPSPGQGVKYGVRLRRIRGRLRSGVFWRAAPTSPAPDHHEQERRRH